MSEEEKAITEKQTATLERRGFFYTLLGGTLAAAAGWIAGIFPRNQSDVNGEADLSSAEARITALETKTVAQSDPVDLSPVEARISDLESKVAEQSDELKNIPDSEPLGHLEGGNDELVVFDRKELSVINPDGVLLNLVATHGPVGIRFYKDFDFGNEQETNPWHMGYIEGLEGYQSLAILRDWRFTAALWDEDGKLLIGKLDPHPPANQPGTARFQVRGTVDEIQAIIEGSASQTTDIFQVTSGDGKTHFIVNGKGNVVIGCANEPKSVILYDTVDGSAYSLQVTNGHLVLTKT